MNSFKKVWIALVVVLIIAIGAYQYPKVSSTVKGIFGSLTCGGSTTCISGGFYVSGELDSGSSNQFQVSSTGTITTSGTFSQNGQVQQTSGIVTALSTTTRFCTVPAPTATSTFTVYLNVTTATSSTQVIALATSTNPLGVATTTYNALATTTYTTGQTYPFVYTSTLLNGFATPATSLIFYYSMGSAAANLTVGNDISGLAGTCGAYYNAVN